MPGCLLLGYITSVAKQSFKILPEMLLLFSFYVYLLLKSFNRAGLVSGIVLHVRLDCTSEPLGLSKMLCVLSLKQTKTS